MYFLCLKLHKKHTLHFSLKELWYCILVSMAVITMLLIVHLRAAGCSLDRGELTAFIIRTIFNKEVFILPHPSSR
jgi:hypothetical protein